MAGNLRYNQDPEKSAELLLKSKEMDLESGWLGKFFGAPARASANIAGMLIFLLVITGIIISFVPVTIVSIGAGDYWTKMLPLITLALGYVFGKQS